MSLQDSWAIVADSGGVQPQDIILDNEGNVIVSGSARGDLGGAIHTNSYGQGDGFISKYSQSGDIQWTVRTGGKDHSSVSDLAIDGDNNILSTVYINDYELGDYFALPNTVLLVNSSGA